MEDTVRPAYDALDFVAVGHVTIDHVDGRRRPGGAVTYAALTARHLGLNAGLVTSAAPDFPFWDRYQGIAATTVASEHTTEFENRYVEGRRRQRVRAVASSIRTQHLTGLSLAPDAAVLYCPVVHEVEAPLIALAPEGLCAVAPQGFFRRLDAAGNVSIREWERAGAALASADVVCLSEEDAEAPEELAEDFPGKAFVVTRGAAGCRVYSGGDVYDFPALPAEAVDPTGAGDVFAASFVIALRQGQPLHEAARFATREAAVSIEFVGIDGL